MAFVNSTPYVANVRPYESTVIRHSHLYAIASTKLEHESITASTDAELATLIPELYRYCRSLTTTSFDAQDLMQDTLLKALTLSDQLWDRDELNRKAYLLRIARNLRIDEARRAVRLQQKLPLLHAQDREQSVPQGELNIEVEAAVSLLFQALSPWQHAVYMLRELLGYTADEAASLLHTTEGAIKSALRRAREALSKFNKDSASDTTRSAKDAVDQELLSTYLAAFRSGSTTHLVQLILHHAADPMGLAPQIIGELHGTAPALQSTDALLDGHVHANRISTVDFNDSVVYLYGGQANLGTMPSYNLSLSA